MAVKTRRKKKRRGLKIAGGIAAATGIGVGIAKRKQIGRKLGIGVKKYNQGSRTAIQNPNGEITRIRINNPSRRKAAEYLAARSKKITNKDINSYLVRERQSKIGGIGGKGRTPGEQRNARSLQKVRAKRVRKKVDKLRRNNAYLSRQLGSLTEFGKKKRKKPERNFVSKIKKSRRNRKINNRILKGLVVAGGLASASSLALKLQKKQKGKNDKNSFPLKINIKTPEPYSPPSYKHNWTIKK